MTPPPEKPEDERALQTRLALLEEALDAISEGFILFDDEDRVVTWNRHFASLFPSVAGTLRPGIAYEDLVRAQYASGQFPSAADDAESRIAARIAQRRNPRGPVEQVFDDGRIIRLTEQRTPSGGIVALRTDITALRRAQADLRNRNHLLLDSVAEAIFGVDLNWRCTFANRACIAALGYDKEFDLLGEDMHALAHHSHESGEPLVRTASPLYSVLDEADGVHVDTEVMWRRDGSCFPVSYRAHPMRRDGTRIGAVVTFLDITRQREAEQVRQRLETRVRQADKIQAVGQLAAGVAHDFNNTLTSVLGFTQLASMELVSGNLHETREHLLEVERACRRAREVVTQLLTFGRAVPRPVAGREVGAVVREALTLLAPTLPASLEVRTRVAEVRGQPDIDAIGLQQAVVNLCINARDAMGGRGVLEVTLDERQLDGVVCASCGTSFDGPHVVLSVRDSGPGMPDEVRERMFDPFFTTKSVGEGSGMGLSALHGTVHDHHGHVLVETGEDGTCVRVALPLRSDAPLASRLDASSARLRIWVVDDEAFIGRLAERVLEGAGHAVRTFDDPLAARERFDADPDAVDLVITDRRMKALDGVALARHLRGARPSLPVILCTGDAGGAQALEREHGLSAVLEKPLDANALLATIARIGER